MKTLPLTVKNCGGNSIYTAFRIVSQDDELIKRGGFELKVGSFTFISTYSPRYEENLRRAYICGISESNDENVLLIPTWLAGTFIEAVTELNEKLSKKRVVVFRYKTGSNPNSVHEVEVAEETTTHLRGIKRGDDGGFRSYLKKNIVGGKIVEL